MRPPYSRRQCHPNPSLDSRHNSKSPRRTRRRARFSTALRPIYDAKRPTVWLDVWPGHGRPPHFALTTPVRALKSHTYANNQSINQSINQSNQRKLTQSIEWSIEVATVQSINQSIEWSIPDYLTSFGAWPINSPFHFQNRPPAMRNIKLIIEVGAGTKIAYCSCPRDEHSANRYRASLHWCTGPSAPLPRTFLQTSWIKHALGLHWEWKPWRVFGQTSLTLDTSFWAELIGGKFRALKILICSLVFLQKIIIIASEEVKHVPVHK